MQTSFVSNGRSVRLDAYPAKAPGKRPAILILHGSGGNSDVWLQRVAPFVSALDLARFAVHYLDATGSSRAEPAQLTDGIHVPLWLQAARMTLLSVAKDPAVDPHRIAIVGISLGAFMALALGTEGSHSIRAIVEISGGLIPPWREQLSGAFPPTLILHGAADTVVPVSFARELDALLTGVDVPHRIHILPAEGHWFTASATVSLLANISQFLKEHL